MSYKNNRGFAVLIVIAVVVLLLGGAWYYFKAPKVPSQKGGGQPTQANQVPNNQAPDNWLTYKNPKHNYTIKYPPEFKAQKDNEPPYPPPPTTMTFSYTYDNNEWCSYEIITFTDTNGFKGEIESIRQEGKDIESQATIDGVAAVVFDTMGGEAISRSYYMDKDSKHFRMGYNYKVAGKYSQDCADVVSQIVASFKFN